MANEKKIRGMTEDQELNEEHLARDTRHFLRKFADWISVPNNMVALMVVFAGICFMSPGVSDYTFLVALGFYRYGMTREEKAPIKMPIQCEYLDPHQPHPGNGKPTKAKGIFFLGNENKSGKEVWLTNDDARQHFLVVGTTGAGKAQPLDAMVHTPSGFVAMGDIEVGHTVSTPDGSTALVKGVYPQGEVDIVAFEFSDGRKTEACTDHLWTVSVGDAESAETISSARVRQLIDAGVTVSVPRVHLDRHDPRRVDAEARLREIMINGNAELTDDGMISVACPTVEEADECSDIVRGMGGDAHVSDRHVTFFVLPSIRLFEDVGREFAYMDRFIKRLDEDPNAITRLRVTKVSDVGRKQAQCIWIDHPEHLYVTDDYVVTHNTESLIGFAANALMWGSGFLFCDGKGDVSLFAKIYALARRFGREDDLLVLNFMTGNQDLDKLGGKIMSNTLNPFSTGSSDSLTQMVVSLMDDAGGDGAMWKGRATAMLTGVMRALSWLRDEDMIDLNVGEIREYMSLKRIVDLGDTNKFPDLPPDIRKSIKSYLTSLPGFQEEKGHKQAQTTLDQHGYLEMQFTKILGSLADVYGHIFFTPNGEVDMFDVVLNRRILVIMLPALEKSGDEIANLGKIVVATLKGMMGATLGSQLEGSWAQVVENRPTNSPSPFICVLDEVGYYTVDGMALMAAQARSLGFTMCYASQDIPAMKRLNEAEAASIIANTNTKVFMRSEEADVTGKLAVDSGGQAKRAQVASYEGDSNDFGVSFKGNMDAQVSDVQRVNFTDLKAQTEGMMHIMFQDKIVRAKSFFANPEGAVNPKKLKLRANHFIKVPKPDLEELERARKMPEITEKLLSEEHMEQLKAAEKEAIKNVSKAEDDITLAMQAYEHLKASGRKPVESGAAALAAVINDQRDAILSFQSEVKKAAGISDLQLPSGEDDTEAGESNEVSDAKPTAGIARKPYNGDIEHQFMIEDDEGSSEIVDMEEDISSNDGIMRALAAIDFDSQSVSEDEVEKQLDDSIDPSDFMLSEDEDGGTDQGGAIVSDTDDAIANNAAALFDDLDGVSPSADEEKKADKADPAEEGSTSSEASSESSPEKEMPDPSNVTTELLSQLILDDDDDD